MAPHYKNRDERAAAVAAGLPADREAVASLALATADRYDAAILNCDAAAFEDAADTFEAIIYHLNGGSLFGSMAEGGGAYQLRDILSPADGTAAGWGRPSRFAVELDDVRAVIRYTPGFLSFAPHFELYAVDVDRPFISETGYQSHFYTADFPAMPVDGFARSLLRGLDARRTLQLAAIPRVIQRCPAWMAPNTLRGQIGFAF